MKQNLNEMNVNKPSNDAKKIALNLYFKMFTDLQTIKLRALELPKEFLDRELFGDVNNKDEGLVDQLWNKLLKIINVKPDVTHDAPISPGQDLEVVDEEEDVSELYNIEDSSGEDLREI